MDAWQKVYTGNNAADTGLIQTLLEQNGIECRLRNFYTSAAIGDLPFLENYPEVWVASHLVAKAEALIKESQSYQAGRDWVCSQCQEQNPSSFETCWNCQGEVT